MLRAGRRDADSARGKDRAERDAAQYSGSTGESGGGAPAGRVQSAGGRNQDTRSGSKHESRASGGIRAQWAIFSRQVERRPRDRVCAAGAAHGWGAKRPPRSESDTGGAQTNHRKTALDAPGVRSEERDRKSVV